MYCRAMIEFIGKCCHKYCTHRKCKISVYTKAIEISTAVVK